MIIIAVRTESTTKMDMLPSLIKKTREAAGIPWGSVGLVIRHSDPSRPWVERMFHLGVFARMHWVPDDAALFKSATHVIVQGPQVHVDRLIEKLRKRRTGIKFKRI